MMVKFTNVYMCHSASMSSTMENKFGVGDMYACPVCYYACF